MGHYSRGKLFKEIWYVNPHTLKLFINFFSDQDHSHRTDSNSNSTLTVVNNNQNSNRTHSPVIPTVSVQECIGNQDKIVIFFWFKSCVFQIQKYQNQSLNNIRTVNTF